MLPYIPGQGREQLSRKAVFRKSIIVNNHPRHRDFWHTLEKPIFILAPMEDVTDTVLRRVIARYGRPAVFFTEFTNVEGMFSKGEKHVVHRLQYTEIERPLVAQIWGSQPENFYRAARKLVDMGFSGVDLNMGC